MTYRVVWEIDIEANSIKEACLKARAIQLDPDSIATYFTVTDDDGDQWPVDLLQ